jgi:hypothetical protein
MVTIFCTAHRLLKLASSPHGQKYNGKYFFNEILKGINQECNQGTGYRVTKTMKIQMDNRQADSVRKYCRQLAE